MDKCELIMLVSTVACTLSKCCSDDDLSILSAIFTQLGDSLATILTKRQLCETIATNNKISNTKDDNILMTLRKMKKIRSSSFFTVLDILDYSTLY